MSRAGQRVLVGLALTSLLILRYGLAQDLTASVSDAVALVSVPAEAAPMAQRALLSFKSLHPQYQGTIALYDEAASGKPTVTFLATESPGLVGYPTLLAVDFLHVRTDLSLDEAQRILQEETSGSDLERVPLATIKERGYAQPHEITLLDYAQRGAGLRLLTIDGIPPTLENYQDGTYPLLTPLKAHVTSPGPWWQPWRRHVPAVSAFLEFLNSEAGQKAWYGQESQISFLALGDVMLARNVGKKIEEYGITYPFGLVDEALNEHDVVIANLESPIGVKGIPIPNKLIWFRATPEAARALVHGGIDMVGLANNHILDYDSESLLETLENLEALGIARTGAGRNLAEARQPALISRGDITVALLAYTEFASEDLYWSQDYPRTFLATEDTPGCAPMELDMVMEDVRKARQQADIVMVTYHWGQEYVNYPEAYFGQDLQEVARRTIEAGADAVLGTHPHAIQGIEIYQGKPIAYSLGNFVMDQYEPISTESMMLSLTLSPRGITALEVVPVRISYHRPGLAQGEDAAYLMEKIRTISLPFRGAGT